VSDAWANSALRRQALQLAKVGLCGLQAVVFGDGRNTPKARAKALNENMGNFIRSPSVEDQRAIALSQEAAG